MLSCDKITKNPLLQDDGRRVYLVYVFADNKYFANNINFYPLKKLVIMSFCRCKNILVLSLASMSYFLSILLSMVNRYIFLITGIQRAVIMFR